MKHSATRLLLLAAALPMLCAAADNLTSTADPTIITVGPQDIKLSEYEFMLSKNSNAATDNESTDQRLDRFALYKMKVLAARDAGLDTAAAHRSELEKYCRELAAPYMFDREMRDSLVQAAYDHTTKLVTLSHIWLQPRSLEEASEMRHLADSLHQVVAEGNADFTDIIKRYSTEPGADKTGGRLTITGGQTPYEFEDYAFSTPVGQITPVFQTRMGIHILRPEKIAQNPGEVKVRHILKRFNDATHADSAIALHAIDSLRSLLEAGADFAAIASANTDDPSGKNSGGDLPWFGFGRMVPEFQDAAFSLPVGALSQPVKTTFGYHLILKEGARPVAPIDSVRSTIENQMSRDSRHANIHRRAVARYATSKGLALNHSNADRAIRIATGPQGVDSTAMVRLAEITLFTIDGKPFTADRAFADQAQRSARPSFEEATKAIDEQFYRAVQNDMFHTLADREPQYASMARSYDEDLLVYEISNREVWDRANTDTEGLEKYFTKHRKDFRWDKPHYIGWVISAETDSLADAALTALGQLPAENIKYAQELRRRFGNKVKIDQVNSPAGQFGIIDYVAFSGPLPTTSNRWKAFRPFRGQVVEQPRSAADIKGQVGMAYQKQLEEEWVKQLRRRYPVKVNKKLTRTL